MHSTEEAYLVPTQQPRLDFGRSQELFTRHCWDLLTALLRTVDRWLICQSNPPSTGLCQTRTTKKKRFITRQGPPETSLRRWSCRWCRWTWPSSGCWRCRSADPERARCRTWKQPTGQTFEQSQSKLLAAQSAERSLPTPEIAVRISQFSIVLIFLLYCTEKTQLI